MSNDINKRLYNSIYRKKLLNKIDSIKDKNILINIYNFITIDIGNNFSSNTNGIFININILSNDCIKKINDYVDEIINLSMINNKNIETVNCSIYNSDDVEILSEFGYKFSNQEKTILKKPIFV